MTDQPGDDLTDKEIRETAVLVIAIDGTLCDGETAESAVIRARKIMQMTDPGADGEWANRNHVGDCTKVPVTCVTCLVEEAEAKARGMFSE